MADTSMGLEIVNYIRSNGVRIFLAIGAIIVLRNFYSIAKYRIPLYRVLKRGLPAPKWTLAAGNLLALPDVMAKIPKDAQQSDAFTMLSYEFSKFDNCFYMDVWPFTAKPFLVITSLELAVQACQTFALPKPHSLAVYFHSFTGGPNIFTTNGPEWKRARSLFNSAFSASTIMQQTAHIVEETEVYVGILREHARKGDTFSLDRLTCDYMMDIIGSVAINDRFESLRKRNPLADALRVLINWHVQDEEMNPFVRWNPIRYLVEWYNGRIMARYIDKALDKRFDMWRHNKPSSRPKSIMDLVIADYMRTRPMEEKLDSEFKEWATRQVRTFLFAGHDSTAATIVYSMYILSKNQDILAKVREEHNAVFGEDISTTAEQLKQSPELINRIPFTTAVIKEVLRLYPPASALREGQPGVELQDKNGTKYPTEGFLLWILHGSIQRNPNYWPEPHTFIPDRWLVDMDHPLHPPKHAMRAFELGPRDCIGQPLAMLDIKITLVLTLREFDFQDQYAEWDRLNPNAGLKTVFGERAYQVSQGASHPVNGMPCRVFQRKEST
ncbi:uncharacterized protein N7484_001875 [Penicillium longicatenatum]|uniref:uncharacterized protein n=1 Tax=Penicillium longicatenatum TaxID=1561947 RepID=UPI002546DBEF|nr:uncharacterized protein N7484_001875 [Penicillium longicatenatum]KAJ5658226.1 hypothetical protein N7484_001875 [Penicillium longicatenatum]